MSYVCKLGRAKQGAILTEEKAQAVVRAGLQCSQMTLLDGHESGIELVLPITHYNSSLQWPAASQHSRSTARHAELPFLSAAYFQLSLAGHQMKSLPA